MMPGEFSPFLGAFRIFYSISFAESMGSPRMSNRLLHLNMEWQILVLSAVWRARQESNLRPQD